MSHAFDGFPLRPRNGAELSVLMIARISTVHQDARSLDDQAALCEGYVRSRYPDPTRFTTIQGRGSGEILDRQDLADAEAAVESGDYDVVAVEDLGRICRRNRAIDFCELCEDAGTRLIAINDSIDTARDDWRLNATQEKIVLRWLKDNPMAHGFGTELWTTPRLAQLIEQEFDVRFNPHGCQDVVSVGHLPASQAYGAISQSARLASVKSETSKRPIIRSNTAGTVESIRG